MTARPASAAEVGLAAARCVLLTTAYPDTEFGRGPDWLRRWGAGCATRLTDDPDEAEAVIFVESHPPADPFFLDVLRHRLTRRHADRVVLYHDADLGISPLRTISPSIERWQYDARTKRSFHYLGSLFENAAVQRAVPEDSPRRYLFSFMGSAQTHPLRASILRLAASDALVRDTGAARAWLLSAAERRDYESAYLESAQASSFVLCPRGVGPTTYRLFETMRLARVPVILSDAWVPIPGVDWDAVAIRVAEADVSRLPELLRARVGEAVAMGWRARAAWEHHFAPEVALDRLAAAAVELVGSPYGARERLRDLAQFRHPWHLRNLARFVWRRARGRG